MALKLPNNVIDKPVTFLAGLGLKKGPPFRNLAIK